MKKFYLILLIFLLSSVFVETQKIQTKQKTKTSTTPQPEIVLLDSKITANWYGYLGWDYKLYIETIKNFLTKQKIKFTVISDEQIPDVKPAKNKLLILPNTRGMSKQNVEAIIKYVSNGGKLFATYQTSIGDEKFQKVVPNRYQLETVFGVKWLRWTQDPTSFGYIKKSTDTVIFKNLPEKIKLYRNTTMVFVLLPGTTPVATWLNNDGTTNSLPDDQNVAIVANNNVVYSGEDLLDPENLKDENVQMLVKNIITYLLSR
ncbi:MAG: hypothetical protein N2Z73_04115 [Endomicrobia bacterium]|nr:hypothetical protein [Endomicrobiia bacterium]